MSTKTTPFPDHFVNPEDKNEEWIKDGILNIWERKEDNGDSFFEARERYHTYDQYMQSNQNISQYLPFMDCDEEENETILNIDWSILPFGSKLYRIAINNLSKFKHDPQVDAIDPSAIDDKMDYQSSIKSKIMLREMFAQNGMNPEAIQMQQDDPRTLDELKMKMEFTWKHNASIELEQGVDAVFTQNKMQEKLNQAKKDIFKYGAAVFQDCQHPDGTIEIKRHHPGDVIISYANDEYDLDDIWAIGVMRNMHIADLKEEAGDKFTESQYEEMAENVLGKHGNPKHWESVFQGNTYGYDEFKIQVLEVYFKSTDVYTWEKRYNKHGNMIKNLTRWDNHKSKKMVTDPHTGEEHPKYSTDSRTVVYKGKWIIDTNFFYDCKREENMIRNPLDKRDVVFPFTIVAPEFVKGRTFGMAEQMIPWLDQLQLAYYKLQNAMAEYVPDGLSFELNSLENIEYGKSGQEMSPEELARIYKHKRYLFWRNVDPSGNPQNASPIRVERGGDYDEIVKQFDNLERVKAQLLDMIGYNDITAGQTPDPRTLKGVAEQMVQSTNNALHHIIDSSRKIVESMTERCGLRLQFAIKHGSDVYYKAIGKNSYDFYRDAPPLHMHDFAFSVIDQPDDREIERFHEQLKEYVAANRISARAEFVIKNTKNLKQAEQLLAFYEEEHSRKMHQQEMEKIKVTTDQQTQSNLISEQEKRKTAEINHGFKMQELAFMRETELLKGRQSEEYKYEIGKQKGMVDLAQQEGENEGEANEVILQGEEQRKTEMLKHKNAMELEKLKQRAAKKTSK